MGADDLRAVLGELMLELDDDARDRVGMVIIRRGAPGSSALVPAPLAERDVAEAVAFAAAIARAGYADPADVDDRLRLGLAAFVRNDYAAAHRIFGALLPVLATGDIDLGQDEMIDEVLSVGTHECAVQYVVSVYMTAEPARRAEMVRAAVDEMSGFSDLFEPILEMERAANETLPGLADFLPAWRGIVEGEVSGPRDSGQARRWLREVVCRIEGPDGLAKIARSTRSAEDLGAWCESLRGAGDWQAALAAYAEAADLVRDGAFARGRFLDGAALAARETGTKDLSPWLRRAWYAAPTMPRLCRWLGGATTPQALHERVAEALNACLQQAARQRAFLSLLQGDVAQAARLLADAPGLGWSDGEHPGHLMFSLFQTLLGAQEASRPADAVPDGDMDGADWDPLTADGDGVPELTTPGPDDLLRDAGVQGVADAEARQVVLAAMREAAERRIAGVTEWKRRRHYGHAASLVAACVAIDGSTETGRWAATLRQQYRRFPALCAELDRSRGAR